MPAGGKTLRENEEMKKNLLLIVFLALIILGAGGLFGYKLYRDKLEFRRQQVILANRLAAWNSLKQLLARETSVYNGSAGVVIKDLKMGWEFSHNKEVCFPSASLVKLPIMAAVYNAAQEGKINLKDTLVLKTSYKAPGSGELKNKPFGSTYSVEELVELMITQSDNTAANMLINLLGFDYLNSYFKQLGLENTNLSRKMMDFKYRKQGVENYTTPADIARLLEMIYRGRLMNREVSQACLEVLAGQKIKDRIPARLPPEALVAHKTGLERNVCHDAGIVFTEKGDFLICVLTKHPKLSRPSKKFIASMALNTYNYYQNF